VDDTEDQKDMYQEMLLQAWKSYATFREASTFSTWLYRICLNTALTYRKKEENRKKIVTEVAAQKVETTSSIPTEEHEILYLIIKQLGEVDRMLITLHLDAYKNHEIADITGMTTNHVNVKIHRLKATIIDQLKKVSDGHI
jgi:RNA polymerase sigma-70 factor (ECF subfamily)